VEALWDGWTIAGFTGKQCMLAYLIHSSWLVGPHQGPHERVIADLWNVYGKKAGKGGSITCYIVKGVAVCEQKRLDEQANKGK